MSGTGIDTGSGGSGIGSDPDDIHRGGAAPPPPAPAPEDIHRGGAEPEPTPDDIHRG